jgi:hypothetical protein
MNRTRRGLAATAALLTIGGGVVAQSASAAPSAAWHKTLTRPVVVKGASLIGATSPTRLLHLDIVLSPRNAKKEKAALKAMYRPSSPRYHKFLTRRQYVARYAPTSAQTAKVTKYLRGEGLRHVAVSKNRQLITATSTVRTASKAFHTGFRSYRAGSKTFYTNTTAASVPTGLGSLVKAVVGLSNAALPMPHPATTKAAAGNPSLDGITPKDFQRTYDATGTATGKKTAIALFTEGSQKQTFKDLRTAEAKNGLPKVSYTEYKVGPQSSDTAGADEWDLDTQTSTAMACWRSTVSSPTTRPARCRRASVAATSTRTWTARWWPAMSCCRKVRCRARRCSRHPATTAMAAPTWRRPAYPAASPAPTGRRRVSSRPAWAAPA